MQDDTLEKQEEFEQHRKQHYDMKSALAACAPLLVAALSCACNAANACRCIVRRIARSTALRCECDTGVPVLRALTESQSVSRALSKFGSFPGCCTERGQ